MLPPRNFTFGLPSSTVTTLSWNVVLMIMQMYYQKQCIYTFDGGHRKTNVKIYTKKSLKKIQQPVIKLCTLKAFS